MRQVGRRADPAPSRLSYRLQRLLLTPLFRFSMRVVLPFAIAFGAGTWWFSKPANQDAFLETIAELRRQVEERPEFMVQMMTIEGASDSVADDIRDILPVDFPVSSFDLHLDPMRDTVVGLDAVETARIYIRPGGVLQVDVTERVPAVIWRKRDGLELIDASGVLVGPAVSRKDWPHLPVIVGDGADVVVGEALTLIAALGPIKPSVRGLVRIGERRWDIVLDRDQRIQLPAKQPRRALERVVALHQATDLLARDVMRVDFRLPERPTVQMTEQATAALRRNQIEAGDNQ